MTHLFKLTLITALLALTAPAFGQTREALSEAASEQQIVRPTLRDTITVSGNVVRIKDVVEHAGAHGNVAIFRAPDPGTTGTVSAAAILDALRAHDVIGVDARNIESVTVTRDSHDIMPDQIKERIAAAIAHRGGLGDAKDITIRFDGEVRPLAFDPAQRSDLQLARAQYNPQTARFEAIFILTSANTPPQRWRYTGTAQELIEVAVLARSIERGTILRKEDVTVEQRPKSEATADYINMERVAGMSIKRAMRAGQIVRESDVSKPELVRRNESVMLIYQTAGIYLTIRGKAEEGGALGDVINITNLQSKRVVQGVITGPGEVTVSPARRISEAAPASERLAAIPATSTVE